MLNYSGYYNRSDDDLPKEDAELFVKSCGHYRLIHLKKMQTQRPAGRQDYQLLYVADGYAHFTLEGKTYDVGKGGIFLYQPGIPQDYYYVLQEKPDIYWIHFSGRAVRPLLESLGLIPGQPIQLTGAEELAELFDRIIIELRLERYYNLEMSEAYFRQLLIMAARAARSGTQEKHGYHSMLDEVINRFQQEYQKDINITELADQYHISCSWFIREFKRYTGFSPKQYLTNLRLQHARELLNNHYLSISDVSGMVGYESQLYFSRIFRKYMGISPSEYRDRDGTAE
jgi:AraC family transcriptional regulator of arabinose operon